MIQANSPLWNIYTSHVLRWEGKTSKDPSDVNAAKCAAFPGAVHTNKGVTYCTFKSMAAKLGITPVNYQKFISMTDEEVGRFIYEFYKKSRPDALPDTISLSITEASWMSGTRSVEHLQKVLGLPVTGKLDNNTINAANSKDEATLFKDYWIERRRFLIALANSPGKKKNYPWKKFKNGWINRLNAFTGAFDKKKIDFGRGFNFTLVSVGTPFF